MTILPQDLNGASRPVPVEAIKEAVSHMLGYAARGVQIKMYADSARAYKYASDIQRWMENLTPESEKPAPVANDHPAVWPLVIMERDGK